MSDAKPLTAAEEAELREDWRAASNEGPLSSVLRRDVLGLLATLDASRTEVRRLRGELEVRTALLDRVVRRCNLCGKYATRSQPFEGGVFRCDEHAKGSVGFAGTYYQNEARAVNALAASEPAAAGLALKKHAPDPQSAKSAQQLKSADAGPPSESRAESTMRKYREGKLISFDELKQRVLGSDEPDAEPSK